MKYPEKFLKHAVKRRAIQTFPYNVIKTFNELPPYIRNSVGTSDFCVHTKTLFDRACQHVYKGPNHANTCLTCKTGGTRDQKIFKNVTIEKNEICSQCRKVAFLAKSEAMKALHLCRGIMDPEFILAKLIENAKSILDFYPLCGSEECKKTVKNSLF